MADEISQTAESVATAAAAIEAAATTKAAEMAAPVVDAAIDAAAERVAAAEKAAQQVVDAALASEIGRQVSDLRKDLSEWKTTVQNNQAEMAGRLTALASELEPLKTQMAGATGAASALISSLTPEKSEAHSGETTITETLNPDGAVVQEVAKTPEAPKRRRILI